MKKLLCMSLILALAFSCFGCAGPKMQALETEENSIVPMSELPSIEDNPYYEQIELLTPAIAQYLGYRKMIQSDVSMQTISAEDFYNLLAAIISAAPGEGIKDENGILNVNPAIMKNYAEALFEDFDADTTKLPPYDDVYCLVPDKLSDDVAMYSLSVGVEAEALEFYKSGDIYELKLCLKSTEKDGFGEENWILQLQNWEDSEAHYLPMKILHARIEGAK